MNNKSISHIAFILDGNKRWAKKNNISNLNGYLKGFENIKQIVNYTFHYNINNITLFTLSSENLKRTSIKIIYEIIYQNFSILLDDILKKNKVKIKIIGSKKNLPIKIIKIFNDIEELTKNNKNFNLNLAFNYGFKDEIKEVLFKYKTNNYSTNLDNDNDIKKLFSLGSLPDPEILIRTGGYKRLSNFIMYNLTYTELFFTETLWPEFSSNELDKIIQSYNEIDRNYGL
ncbi:MAG: di-trans,poly-cis-decaprenylcistransferase [Pelagibacteraceae bacterium TMED237]|nr:MAG: di-trans,poly-cis-decaprenylcistransferase [Pelagibacteraceae bacterium TMED237]